MTIDEQHSFIKFLANQGQNRYFPPEDIDRAINAGQIDKFNEDKKRFAKSRYVIDNLVPFFVDGYNYTLSGFPSNYDTIIHVQDSTNERVIEIVEPGDFIQRRYSEIEPPSEEFPVCSIRNNSIRILPTSVVINNIYLHYLKTPTDVEWAYTTSGNDLIYNVAGSTNLEWPESCHVDITLRACVYLGIPINDQGLSQLKAYKKQTEDV